MKLPSWNLNDLYQGPDDPQLETDLATFQKEAETFEVAHRGKIAAGQLTPQDFLAVTQQIEQIQERGDKLLSYAQLLFAADTSQPEHGRLLSHLQERLTEINTHLLFYELELIRVPEKKLKRWTDSPLLSPYHHFLNKLLKGAPHRLSEPEEKILEEKANTGIRAFQRLFDEGMSRVQYTIKRKDRAQHLPEQEALSLLHDPDRTVRKAAARGLTEGFKHHAPLFTFIFNQVLADHASDNRLRHFESPIASRNLANEIDPGAVEMLLSLCESHYSLVARYYELKKRRLNLTTLYDYDRYAPMTSQVSSRSFEAAKQIVLSSFDDFSPQMKKIADRFFQEEWIDAARRPGKQGGAFSHGMTPSHHPYVFLNYCGRPRDVMTLAHELGHGVHQWLSRRQSHFNFHTPLTTAETASVFAEMLVFHRLKQAERDPLKRLSLVMEKLEEGFATIFRQVVLCRFEQRAHAARGQEGELPVGRINALWMETNAAMFGRALTLTTEYQWWWIYIPHCIHSPFYTYAYAFGHLLVLALYQKYLEEGASFVSAYLHVLSLGGSEDPEKMLQREMGIHIGEKAFWQSGLHLLEDMLGEAETLNALPGPSKRLRSTQDNHRECDSPGNGYSP